MTIACLALLPGLEKYAQDPITETVSFAAVAEILDSESYVRFRRVCAEGTCFESPEFKR